MQKGMSALPPIATAKADGHFRSTRKSRHEVLRCECLLSAQNGHSGTAVRDFASAARQSSSATGGGTGELHDTAVSLMRGRTMIAVHCDYHDDARMLCAWFTLPEPLPPDGDIERGEIVGDW